MENIEGHDGIDEEEDADDYYNAGSDPLQLKKIRHYLSATLGSCSATESSGKDVEF